MLLKKYHFTNNDVRKYTVDYSKWLAPGVIISSLTVATSHEASTEITNATHTSNVVTFYLTTDELNISFTVTIQITDSTSQVKTDTISFFTVPK